MTNRHWTTKLSQINNVVLLPLVPKFLLLACAALSCVPFHCSDWSDLIPGISQEKSFIPFFFSLWKEIEDPSLFPVSSDHWDQCGPIWDLCIPDIPYLCA